MLKLRTLGFGILLIAGAAMTIGCGETVYQLGVGGPPQPPPPPEEPAPPPPPPPPPVEEKPVVEVKGDEIKINDTINFGNNSSVIETSSFSLIDKIANVIKQHPDIDFIEIAGHASASGGPGINNPLTTARANAVMAALVERGIEAKRMRARGYGAYCEKSPGNDDANRRVEFLVLRRAGENTSVQWGGCDNATQKAGMRATPIPASAPSSKK
ncbi:MAG: OmpA family protein [Polyangiaceae bacterium]|nr:OmpA family protein [Polyangiaceae bacterium]